MALFFMILAFSCSKSEYENLNNFKSTSQVNPCVSIFDNEINLGELHNQTIILLYQNVDFSNKQLAIDQIKLNFKSLPFSTNLNSYSRGDFDNDVFQIADKLAIHEFNIENTPEFINSEDLIKPFVKKVLLNIDNFTSVKSFNDNLDLILIESSSVLNCQQLDILKGTIEIGKASAKLWSPVDFGGIGFYEETVLGYNYLDKAPPEWLKRTIKGDVSSSCAYFMTIGVGGTISASLIPGTNVALLGGWALSAGFGSALTGIGA